MTEMKLFHKGKDVSYQSRKDSLRENYFLQYNREDEAKYIKKTNRT